MNPTQLPNRVAWLAIFVAGVVGGIALSVALLGRVATARTQATFPDGAFVQGQDETRWVVGGGHRFRMAFVSDDAGTLPGLPEGNPVATVCEAAAAVAGTDAAAACGTPVTVAPPSVPVAPDTVVASPPPTSDGGLPFEVVLDIGPTARIVRSETFTINSPTTVELCWELSGPHFANPAAAVSLHRQTPGGFSAVLSTVDVFLAPSGCRRSGAPVPAGTYRVESSANYRSVRITVRAP